MTQVVDLNSFNAGATFPQLSVGELARALGLPDEPYTIRVVDMAGGLIAALTSEDPTDPNQAQPEDIVETLNAYMTFAITFPKHAFTKAQVDLLGNTTTEMEIQVLLGDEVIAWGPAIAEGGGSNAEAITLQCAGVDWYFAKRAIDEEKTNLLSFGGFENGDLAGWNDSGTTLAGAVVGDGCAATIETDNVFQGTYAVRLTAAGPPTGLALVSEPVNFTAGPIGNRIALSFSFCIESFFAPALYNAGVMLIAGPPGADELGVGGVNSVGTQVYRIDETTPRNVEVRESLEVQIPPNQTWRLQVWVFVGALSVTVFDHFFMAPKKRLATAALTGSATATVDVSRIMRMIADHTFSNLHGHNKSNLHIGLDTPDCGIKQARRYEFDEHIPVDQAYAEFLNRDDCVDAAMEYTATTRTWRLFPIADGGQGVDRSGDVTLTYGQAPFASYTTALDGGSTATQIAALGDSSGSVREESWHTDTSAIGGTTLQDAISAPPGAPFNSLEPLARSAVLLRRKAAEVIEVVVTREAGGYGPDDTVILHDLLRLGDRLTLAIVDGWHTYDGVWRIVRRTRHSRARTMQYTLNRVVA